jgi:hypothetical protein
MPASRGPGRAALPPTQRWLGLLLRALRMRCVAGVLAEASAVQVSLTHIQQIQQLHEEVI